ncbi:DUF551 domain-containing protein [Salmonella enterica]|nr:DUF551 domain-containing protein [Salmonella enterica]
MTTVTRERLTKILIETMALIKQRSSCTGDSSGISTEVNAELFAEIARMALASLDAEPVAWTDEQELRDVEKDGLGYMFTVNPIVPGADPCRVIRLYAAPPAPVMPEECPEEIRDLMASHSDALFNDDDAQEIWNACRAAMLNGDIFRENSILSTNNFREIAETSTNSQVIPDGWISCSKRMPEQGAYISAVSRHGEYVAGQVIDDWLDLHDGTSFGLDEVYLWMMLPPLPAAPQQ